MLTPRSNEQPLVLFKLGPRLSAMHLSNIGGLCGESPVASASACPVGQFVVAWTRFLSSNADAAHLNTASASLEHVVPFVLSHLVQCSAMAFTHVPPSTENALLTVQGRCFNALLSEPSPSASVSASASPTPSPTELCLAKELIRGLERTDVHRAVLAFLLSGPSRSGALLGSLAVIPDDSRDLPLPAGREGAPQAGSTSSLTPALRSQSTCDCRQLLSAAHMLSALLLAWPYDQITARAGNHLGAACTTAQALERLVDAQLLSASCALLNELRQLRTQLAVLLYNSNSSA